MSRAAIEAVEQYLGRLPGGLDAHPECQMKGSVLRAFATGLPRPLVADGNLPEPVRELIATPSLPTAWIPEVHATALIVFASAACFDDAQSFLEHAHRTNYALLDSLAYRVLFRLIGATRLAAQAAARWSVFHKGTSIDILSREDGAVRFRLKAPAHHVPRVLAQAYATAFRAALEISGQRDVTFDTVQSDACSTEFRGRWS
ncbi:MAG: hypothetical protein U0271_39875 [Polyangiaceae bacterium]